MEHFVSVGDYDDASPINLTSQMEQTSRGQVAGTGINPLNMMPAGVDMNPAQMMNPLFGDIENNQVRDLGPPEDRRVDHVDAGGGGGREVEDETVSADFDNEDEDDEDDDAEEIEDDDDEDDGAEDSADKEKQSDSEAEEKEVKENFPKGKIFELIDSPNFWNVRMICSDGIVEQNKLTVGLVWPGLKNADIFTFHQEPHLIMAEFTKAEVHFIIQEELKKMYKKHFEKEEEEEETEGATDNTIDNVDETIDEEDEYEERRTRRGRKRGRPRGSTNRKKIKMEPGDWDDGFDDLNDFDLLESEMKVKYEDSVQGSTRGDKGLLFPVNFDLKAANDTFNALLDDVKEKSEKLNDEYDKKERWKCSLCNQVCANLAVHVGRKHAPQDFICSQCDVRVGSEYLLRLHGKTHLNEKKPCRVCGKVVKDMKNHMVQKHQGESKNKIQCTQCPKVYVKNAEFQRHYNSAHLGIKARCPICNKELLPNKIKSHIRMVHDQVKNHFCSNCGKGFYDKRDMELHIQRIHLNTKELCIECGKELSAGQLKNHIKKCHSGESFKVICPVCGKKVGYLDEHMRSVHKKEKNHQCPKCPLKCYKRNTLKRHLEWHEKGKLTVSGAPKKPRILKRDKEAVVEPQQQPQMMPPPAMPHVTEQPHFPQVSPGFRDPANLMHLANFYNRGHTM